MLYTLKKRLSHILLMLGFILILLFASNNANAIQFKPMVAKDLPTNEIRKLYQDKNGYIWITSYGGLYRFDGYSVVSYKSDVVDETHPLDNFVNIVVEDNEKKLWIGTHNGLYVLDKKTNKITKILVPVLQKSNIEALIADSKGDLWIGSSNGLFRRKKESDEFENMKSLDVKSIMEDSKQQIWIGTWEQDIYRYNPKEKHFYVYTGLNPGNSGQAVFQDESDNIWIGTWRYGLLKLLNPYDMERYSFCRYIHDPNNPNSLLDNIIYTITQDKRTKKLWIGSRSGISVLENESGNGSFTNYVPGNKQDNLPFNEVNALLCSNDGLMWVGMLGGGICTANTKGSDFSYNSLEIMRKYFPSGSVRSIYQEDNGGLWLGIMGFGLVYYDEKNLTLIHRQQHSVLKQMNYVSTVNDIIYRKATDELCFATWDDGVWFYNKKKNKAYALNRQTNPELADVCIYSVFEDSGENLWIGSRAGVFILDKKQKLYSLDKFISQPVHLLPQESVFKIMEDRDGYVWIVSGSKGVWRIGLPDDSHRVKIYSPSRKTLSSLEAVSGCVDQNGRVWIGTTNKGLYLYNRDKDCFETVLKEYFVNGNAIFSILEDDTQRLWLATNSGIYHINMPLDNYPEVYIYTESTGLQNYFFNRNSCFKGRDNMLFFGGFNGLSSFEPGKVLQDTTRYPLVITDIKIQNTSLRDLPYESRRELIGDEPIDEIQHLTLSYNSNNFTIDFSILDYTNSELNHFSYKLDGFDSDWLLTKGKDHLAYYNNLPTGEYTFYVKGANQAGVWSSNTRQLQIKILPPPWLSWWAYCIYILLFLTFGWYIYVTVRNRIRLRQSVEIEKIKRKKTEEVNQIKLQFFTNITHELLTPLSIISAATEELKQHLSAPSQISNVLAGNTQKLIRLIQQVLEFRKAESGKLRLKVSYGNISLFLRNVVSAFDPLLKQQRLTVKLNFAKDYFGYFDADKLDKVIYNLLSNAAKYTPKGNIITVVQAYNEPTGILTVSINNPGDFIPKEKLNQLFERFYEGQYRKFHTIGTGIGLSLTKDLMHLHRGSIEAMSDRTEGNTFTVKIPIIKSAFLLSELDESFENTINLSETTKMEEDFLLDSDAFAVNHNTAPIVLLVEDNNDLSAVMSRLLSARYTILTACNGIEALSVLENKEVNLIVSDIMMPQMDGLELCKQVKAKFETCHIPLILLTAKTGDDDKILGYDVDADGYICKPVKLQVLFAKIDNLLRKQENRGVDFRKQLVFDAKELEYTSLDEVFIKKAIECVNNHIDNSEFGLSHFVAEMAVSRTTLTEKLKLLTGLTPSGFINNVRIQAACRLMEEQKQIRISDLAYAVGFDDPKYFSSCFKKKFGYTPTEYIEKKAR